MPAALRFVLMCVPVIDTMKLKVLLNAQCLHGCVCGLPNEVRYLQEQEKRIRNIYMQFQASHMALGFLGKGNAQIFPQEMLTLGIFICRFKAALFKFCSDLKSILKCNCEEIKEK